MVEYKQVIIAQVGSTTDAPFFAPYQGLVWSRNFYLTVAEQAASFWTTNFGGTYDDVNPDVIAINTVTWNGQQLSRYDSLAELSLTTIQDAFYFDFDMQVLYIKNFYNYPPWQTQGISVGVVVGYSSMADVTPGKRPFNEAYFGQEHEPRLIASSVDDSQTLEDWNKNQMVFKNATISLINSDGELDNVRNQIMNQRMDILLADVPADKEIESTDFNVVTTGVISDVSFPNENTVTITASDRRKSWEDTIPGTLYTAGFGGLVAGDNSIDKNMQLMIGSGNKVPCVTLDRDNGTYHIGMATADNPIASVSGVFVYENEVYTAAAYTVDLDTGIITLNVPGNADSGTVCCDCVGITAPSITGNGIDNTPLDIAIYLIENYGNMPYVNSLFDIPAINSIRDFLDFPAGLFIASGGDKLRDIVEQCTFSVNTVLYQQGSMISAATLTPDVTSVFTLYPDILTAMPSIAYGNKDYMSRISVGYNLELASDEYQTVADSSLEDDAVLLYQYKVQYDFETVLVEETDAAAMGDERYQRQWQILPDLEALIANPIEFNFLDTVEFAYTMNGREMLPNALYRVTSLSKIKRTARLEYIEEITA